ncbi:spore germination protein [Aneurinibacillus tyrosinisolvens]|jgi:spore germination protein PF|uniref:spore germination protein n=1 Tax=Aneurinibacillus tyrosinisolvens TaxID=1443435 RepID=UPI00063F7D2A|nr:spore germination protein [Aneurinibacillus tyrosinisolvens]
MSSIIGAINIGSMDNGSTIITKKSVILSPKSTSTTNDGSGSGNTANFMENFNRFSSTNTNEPHSVDQNIAGIV